MFCLRRGLEERAWSLSGRFGGGFYAIGMMISCLGAGNMFEANQAYVLVRAVTGGAASPIYGYGWSVGLVLAVVVGGVILGGIKSIAAVTEKLVPMMAGLYFVGAFAVIAMNIAAASRSGRCHCA
ncbi:MAG: AGCS family alanine or glycine:cation symporter, partial [Myxococcota bacterium]